MSYSLHAGAQRSLSVCSDWSKLWTICAFSYQGTWKLGFFPYRWQDHTLSITNETVSWVSESPLSAFPNLKWSSYNGLDVVSNIHHHWELVLSELSSIFKERGNHSMRYFFLSARKIEGDCLLDDFLSDFRNELLPDVIEHCFDYFVVNE